MSDHYYWGEPPKGEPLHLGILPMHIAVIEGILPKDYRIVGLSYDEWNRTLNLVLTSDALPATEAEKRLPQLSLTASFEALPDHPEYRHYKTEITVL